MPTIKTEMDNLDIDGWNDFVYKHPNGNIFQTPQMVALYKRTKNYAPIVLIAENKDEIIGVLVGVIQKEFKGVLGYFTARCIVFGGPLVKNDDKMILEKLLKIFNKKVRTKVIYTQFRNFFDVSKVRQGFEKAGIKYEPHLDIHIDLNQKPEEYWNGLKSKLRQNIRKADKKGIEFEQILNKADLKEGITILKKVYKDAGLPVPNSSFFFNAYDIFSEKGNAAFFKASCKNEIIGVRFVLLYNKIVFDWYAGSKKEYYRYHPNDFLIFNVLAWGMKNENYHLFDFGGAGKPNVKYGVRDHKLKFSENIKELGRFQKIHNPFFYNLGKLGLKILSKIK